MTPAARPSVTPRVGDQITTAAQLAALPRGTVLIDHAGVAWQRDLRNRPREDMWLCAGGGPQGLEQPYFVAYYGPFTVVRVPGVDPDRPSVIDDARAEAWRRFPNGIDVETGEPVDDYGYPETAREAFIEGAEWAAGRAETTTEATERIACQIAAMSAMTGRDALELVEAVQALQDAETTTEWAHMLDGGGASIHRTRQEAEQAQRDYLHQQANLYFVDDPPGPPSAGIFRREVTEWKEADQ